VFCESRDPQARVLGGGGIAGRRAGSRRKSWAETLSLNWRVSPQGCSPLLYRSPPNAPTSAFLPICAPRAFWRPTLDSSRPAKRFCTRPASLPAARLTPPRARRRGPPGRAHRLRSSPKRRNQQSPAPVLAARLQTAGRNRSRAAAGRTNAESGRRAVAQRVCFTERAPSAWSARQTRPLACSLWRESERISS
jgi:hypothetical protein